MVKKKGKSKRTTLKDKYKIQKRVVESHRKSKKQAKRDSKAGIVTHKKKKDPGIPNSWPFKQDLLNEIARARELAENAKLETKQNKSAKNLEELVARADASRAKFNAKVGAIPQGVDNEEDMRTPKTNLGEQSRRAYLSTLRKVIDTSDIILQVLDARDPMGTRIHPSIEETILNHYDKKMVLVLNKIDLIPKDAVSGWLNYLRRSRPTLAIKCGTNIKSGVGRSDVDCQGALSSSCGVGVDGLMGLLKNYTRTSGGGGKTCVTVGIIGYPNVGKSSILNTLKRSRAVGVSPRPGFTTSMQEVVLDRNLRLIDSPGVVFDDSQNLNDGVSTMLRNCVDADSVEDPIPAVKALLDRCSTESLMMTYSIPAFPKGDVMVFLAMIAKRNGRVLKGGIPDKIMAARTIIRDWNSGKIPFYTKPPTMKEENDTTRIPQSDAKIVSGFADEFDLSKMDAEVMKSLDDNFEMDFVQMETENNDDSLAKTAPSAVSFLTGKDDEDVDMDGGNGPPRQKMISTNDVAANADDYDFGGM